MPGDHAALQVDDRLQREGEVILAVHDTVDRLGSRFVARRRSWGG